VGNVEQAGCSLGNVTCPAGAMIVWFNHTINGGQSSTFQFAALMDTANAPPNGTLIRSTAAATGGGSGAGAAVDVVIAP